MHSNTGIPDFSVGISHSVLLAALLYRCIITLLADEKAAIREVCSSAQGHRAQRGVVLGSSAKSV